MNKLLLSLLLILLFPLQALAAFAIDGTPAGASGNCTASVNFSYATSNANAYIYVYLLTTNDPGSPITGTVSDNGSSLTWAARTGTPVQWGAAGVTGGNYAYEYYALAATSGTKNMTISFGNTSCGYRYFVFAVDGQDTSNPFDSNITTIKKNVLTTGTAIAPSSSITTNCTSTMLITLLRLGAAETGLTNPTGFTTINTATTTTADSYNTYAATQSGLSPQWTWTGSTNSVGLWDVLRGSGTSCGGGGAQSQTSFWFAQ